MDPITPQTRISKLIKADERAIDALVEVSDKFKKLRIPLMRKMMAPRCSLAEAARIGKVPFSRLKGALEELGFEVQDEEGGEEKSSKSKGDPSILKELEKGSLRELDVRPIIEADQDPYSTIQRTLRELRSGEGLKLINSFAPLPLIRHLERRGYAYYMEQEEPERVVTYLLQKKEGAATEAEGAEDRGGPSDRSIEELFYAYEGEYRTIDVRGLEMPEPMMRVLEEVRNMTDEEGLFVQHERVPRFLLPELDAQGFQYALEEIEEGDVRLFIFKAANDRTPS